MRTHPLHVHDLETFTTPNESAKRLDPSARRHSEVNDLQILEVWVLLHKQVQAFLVLHSDRTQLIRIVDAQGHETLRHFVPKVLPFSLVVAQNAVVETCY